MRRIIGLLAAVVIVWLVMQRESASTSPTVALPPATTSAPPAPAQTNPPPTSSTNSGKGFRDRAHLDDHFAKHGGEFPGLNESQYLAMAQTLRDAPAGGDVLEIIRASDGVVSRFDKRSGAFLAFDRDGTIRTFFKPNDGEKYFRRQANRAPAR